MNFNILKKLIFGLLFFFTNNLFAQKTYQVKARMLEISSYCGGARPDKSVKKQLATPRPILNKVYYIKEGVENNENDKVVAKLKTNKFGEINANLKPGKYYIIEKLKNKKCKIPKNTNELKYDSACFAQKWKDPLLVFKVVDTNIIDLEYLTRRHCIYNVPCTSYSGPMPQMSKPVK